MSADGLTSSHDKEMLERKHLYVYRAVGGTYIPSVVSKYIKIYDLK